MGNHPHPKSPELFSHRRSRVPEAQNPHRSTLQFKAPIALAIPTPIHHFLVRFHQSRKHRQEHRQGLFTHRISIGLPGIETENAMVFRTLIVDSPGVERLVDEAEHWPHPWRLVPHPVAAKRHWSGPLAPEDHTLGGPPEAALRGFGGVVVVGESLVLLAALSLCGPGVKLVVALPRHADANLWRLIRAEAARDTRLWLLPDFN